MLHCQKDSNSYLARSKQRFTTPENPIANGRSLIVKLTRMFSF